MKNALATQVMTMAPPQKAVPRPDTSLPFEQRRTCQEGQQLQACAQQPTSEQQVAQQQSKLIGKQATTAVQSHVSPWHEPSLGAERILIVYFASTQARANEVTPSASREGAQTEAVVARPLSTSPPLTTNQVDKMYHQLVEFHTITTAQLVDCARWCRSIPTPGTVRARTGRQTPVAMPSVTMLVPLPPTDFLSWAPLWWQGQHFEPQAHC
jgi:hypothetical protein